MKVVDFVQAIYLLCPSPIIGPLKGVTLWFDAMKRYKAKHPHVCEQQ